MEEKATVVAKPKLDGLGKAISETIALKELILTREDKLHDTQAQIKSNEQTIASIERLKESTSVLRDTLAEVSQEIDAYKAELDKRVNKLADAGIAIPLNDEKSVKGFANL